MYEDDNCLQNHDYIDGDLSISVWYDKSNDGIGSVLADHGHYDGDHDHDRNPHTDTNIRIVILVSVFG